MGVVCNIEEVKCPVSARRIFNALIVDSNNLLPKLLPQFIKNIDVHGDGGVGTIEQVNYSEASQLKYVKHRIDKLDVKGLICKYTIFDGQPFDKKLQSISHELKFEDYVNGGSVCKMLTTYITKDYYEVDENDVKDGADSAMQLYRVVEAYLLENPMAYAWF